MRYGRRPRRIGPIRPQFNCPNCGASADQNRMGIDPGTETGLSCPSCRTRSYRGRRFVFPSTMRRNPRSGHTPGPWEVRARGAIYAVPWNSHITTVVGGPEGHEDAQANARLIASAPDLLGVLKEAEEIIFGPIADLITGDQMAETGAYDVLDTIRKAIAKAEGRN